MTISTRKVIVVGSGLAGLSAALTAAEAGLPVRLFAGQRTLSGSSVLAQGGIAAAIGPDDSAELHYEDTLAVGAGLNDAAAVRVLTEEAPAAASRLLALGAPLEQEAGRPVLALEAGHSRRRVLHGGSGESGRVLTTWMFARAERHPLIEVTSGDPIQDLLLENGRVTGVRSSRQSEEVGAVVLATGGYGALWGRTTNDPGTRGQGLELAWRAGAELADLEMVQFHPTALDLPGRRAFLLSEALRGEGAIVVDEHGREIAPALLPRDVLARTIHRFKQDHGPVFLSLRHLDAAAMRQRFAALAAQLSEWGLDIASDLLPIAPAAHYCMGGVRTDVHGRTNVPGLYAAGEVTCTGVHGANRLASNSLLECLVFGGRAGAAAAQDEPGTAAAAWPRADLPAIAAPTIDPQQLFGLNELPGELDAHLAVERDAAGLQWLASRLGVSPDNGLALPWLLVRSALSRTESRGAHFRTDWPESSPAWRGRIVWQRDRCPAFEPVTI